MKRLLKRKVPLLVGAVLVAALAVLGASFWPAGYGDDFELRLSQAKVALANGNAEQALAFAEKLLAIRPGDAEAARICREANEMLEQNELDAEGAGFDSVAIASGGPVVPVDWTFIYADRVGRREADIVDLPPLGAQLDQADGAAVAVPTASAMSPAARGVAPRIPTFGDPSIISPGGYQMTDMNPRNRYWLDDPQYAYTSFSNPGPSSDSSSSSGGGGSGGGGGAPVDGGEDDTPGPEPMLGAGAAPEPASLGTIATLAVGLYALRRRR